MYLIAAILMISFGLIFIAAFLQPAFSKKFGERFEVVKGEIVKSQMKQGLLEKTEAGLMNYSYDIEYAYQFDGKLRKSSKVYKYLEQSSSEKIFVTQILKKYPLGTIVDVCVSSKGGGHILS